MKHTIIKAKPAGKIVKAEKISLVKATEKGAKTEKINSAKGTKATKRIGVSVQNIKSKEKKAESTAATGNTKALNGSSPVLNRKAAKIVSSISIKKASRDKIASGAAQKAEPAEKAVETTIAAPRKAKPKKTKPIGAAVFRGRKERYDFQVYPLDAEFENIPAIYVISKRKTDRNKRAHHALVCIGQSDSITGELKKHTKGKCVKKHQANVISILPEANEKKRLKIEEDLKAAHAIACNIS